MIFAGLLLLGVGGSDLVRQFVPRRWIGYLVAGVVILVLGITSAALWQALAAVALGAVWVWAMPTHGRGILSFWPAVILAALSTAAVVLGGTRSPSGLVATAWYLDSPFGAISFDRAVLAVGVLAFLLESGNVVVRASLAGERISLTPEGGAVARPEDEEAPVPVAGFTGGRLIGPLERVIVTTLTLAGVYPLLAAILAAKGIVRFPEISRGGDTGISAEYFLVGSLVSWLIALGGAFLVWWAGA